MKKHFVKTVAVATILIFILSSMSVFALSSYDKMGVPKVYVRTGEIFDLSKNTVKIGEKSDKIIFRIVSETQIMDQNGKYINVSSLEEGMDVEITYTKNSSNKKDKSYEAKTIQILEDKFTVNSAVIEEISSITGNKLMLTIYYETADAKNRVIENYMNIIADNNTKIIDQFGIKADKSELELGMTVHVEHGNVIDTLYPNQAYASCINIIRESENSGVIEAKILEKEIVNGTGYLLIGNSKNVSEQIMLIISDNTKIKNINGKEISFNKLLVGQTVRAEHSLMMTKSLPPQSQAYSIRVTYDNVGNTDNTELEDIYILLDKVFKELKMDNWRDYLKYTDINDRDDDDSLKERAEDIVEDIIEKAFGKDYDDEIEYNIEKLIEKLIKDMKIPNIK